MPNRKISADLAEADPAAVQGLWNAARGLGDKVSVMLSPQSPLQGGFADPCIAAETGVAA